MKRREFVVGLLALLVPLLQAVKSHAQTPGKVYRVAVISPIEHNADWFRKTSLPELAKAGFVEGRNLVVTTHIGPASRITELVSELLAGKPDVAMAGSEIAILAIKATAPALPMVMAFSGQDPVALGLAESLGRPGGSVTGTLIMGAELDGKRASLLHETAPAIRRLAILTARPPRQDAKVAEAKRVVQSLGVEVLTFPVDTPADYPAAFAAMRDARAEALLIISGPEFFRDAVQLSRLAIQHKLPTMCEWASMARDGCLIGYGPKFSALWLRATDHVIRIVRGTPPGNIPIEQPTVFELIVNLKTAAAIGVTVPTSILLRADEVIE
jgi:putative tryptophan/tyrosine transport system substrate-binding protein